MYWTNSDPTATYPKAPGGNWRAPAFARTASYDATIVEWFDASGPRRELLPPSLHVTLERADVLRYGENPHQPGARYRRTGLYGVDWWDRTQQLGGMPMSYLNLLDAGAAWALVHDMGNRPSAAVIKHGAPCGAAPWRGYP